MFCVFPLYVLTKRCFNGEWNDTKSVVHFRCAQTEALGIDCDAGSMSLYLITVHTTQPAKRVVP